MALYTGAFGGLIGAVFFLISIWAKFIDRKHGGWVLTHHITKSTQELLAALAHLLSLTHANMLPVTRELRNAHLWDLFLRCLIAYGTLGIARVLFLRTYV